MMQRLFGLTGTREDTEAVDLYWASRLGSKVVGGQVKAGKWALGIQVDGCPSRVTGLAGGSDLPELS